MQTVNDNTAADRAAASGLYGGMDADALFAKVAEIAVAHPGNLCTKFLTREIFDAYGDDEKAVLYRCVNTSIENPGSSVGCYAMQPNDYSTFGKFFDPLIRQYHGATAGAIHVTDWDVSAVGEGGVLNVAELGLGELSMRVRVGRNLKQYNLPGMMDKAERIAFEMTMLTVFRVLMNDPDYGGTIYSLTPEFADGEENPNLISFEKYTELVKAHAMFKDMEADPFLKSSGISSDWPYGRGSWQSEDGACMIWFGEEDQLRIMCMKKGTVLSEVYERLNKLLQAVEAVDGIDFAFSDDYGYVTSCPSNLGTGMRASVQMKVPNLTKDGTVSRVEEVASPLGLSIRGAGGEHTPIGADGTVDVSPSARLFIRECEIIEKLYTGVKLLLAAEKAAAAAAAANDDVAMYALVIQHVFIFFYSMRA